MRWSERRPAARLRFAWLVHAHCDLRAFSVAVAHLVLVRPMRVLPLIVATAVCCSLAEARAQEVKRTTQASARTPEDAAKMIGSARFLYHQQVHTMLEAAVTPEFMRHHERLKGGTVNYAHSRRRSLSLFSLDGGALR